MKETLVFLFAVVIGLSFVCTGFSAEQTTTPAKVQTESTGPGYSGPKKLTKGSMIKKTDNKTSTTNTATTSNTTGAAKTTPTANKPQQAATTTPAKVQTGSTGPGYSGPKKLTKGSMVKKTTNKTSTTNTATSSSATNTTNANSTSKARPTTKKSQKATYQ